MVQHGKNFLKRYCFSILLYSAEFSKFPEFSVPKISHLCLNPISTGLFLSRFLMGGGGQFEPPLEIPVAEGPIGAKICTHVKTRVKNVAALFFFARKFQILLIIIIYANEMHQIS